MGERAEHEHTWEVVSSAGGKHTSLCMGADGCFARRVIDRHTGDEAITAREQEEPTDA